METVAKSPTKLTHKLRRLCKGRDHKELANAAGVTRQAIAQYLEGSTPGPGVLLALAKTFTVPIEWLIDDTLSWPPPNNAAVLLSDRDLMLEVARRYREEALRVIKILKIAEKTDWYAVAEKLFKSGLDWHSPERVDVPSGLLAIDYSGTLLLRCYIYDLASWQNKFHTELPGSDKYHAEDLYIQSLHDRLESLLAKNPGIGWMLLHHNMKAECEMFPDRRKQMLDSVSTVLKKIKNKEEARGANIAVVIKGNPPFPLPEEDD